MLTDYHVHLRPDEPDASAAEYHTAANAERYREAAARAGDRRAGRLRTHLPLHAGARGLAPPLLGDASPTTTSTSTALRARADRPAPRHRGRLRPRRRGPHWRTCSRPATSTTWWGRSTSCATAPWTWTTTASGTAGAASRTIWRRYFQTIGEAARSGLFDVLAHPDLVKYWGAQRRARARRRPAPLLRARDRRHRRVGHRRRGLHRRPAQAGRRDLPGAGLPGDVPGSGRAGGALQRRPPPAGRRRRLRAALELLESLGVARALRLRGPQAAPEPIGVASAAGGRAPAAMSSGDEPQRDRL